MPLDPWNVGERVHRHPVGPQLDHLPEVLVEGLQLLPRQSVDEVEIDAFGKTHLASVFDHRPGLLDRLISCDRLLHLGRQVLYAHAEPVEPKLHQAVQMFRCRHARIDLDGDLCV